MTPADDGKGYDTCGGKTRSGTNCQRPAGWGTDHVGIGSCKLHGGSTPNHRKAARIEQARRATVTLGLPQDGDPFDILLEEIARTNGHVLWLHDVVSQLDEASITWGLTESEDQTGEGRQSQSFSRTKQGAGVNVWVQLYQAERIHLVRVCKEAISAGIAERQVQLAEQTGQLIAQVMRATLADPELGLTPDRQEAGLRVVSRHLRALPAA